MAVAAGLQLFAQGVVDEGGMISEISFEIVGVEIEAQGLSRQVFGITR